MKHIVNYSLKKEISFITLGSILGALIMAVPNTISDVITDSEFYMFWVIAARALGSSDYTVGILVHLGVATIIGIIVGLILYKGRLLNISRIRNGLLFGLLTGGIVTVIFAVPVQYFWIQPVIADLEGTVTKNVIFSEGFLVRSFMTHFLWGGTLGVIASILTIKKGINYRCHTCDIEFSKLSIFEEHHQYIHVTPRPDTKRIIILGGGYAGVGVLEKIQKKFERDVGVDICIISENNFFLHTPMLPELAAGMIEPRHIATPIRNFCRRARFYQARILGVDLDGHTVRIQNSIQERSLHYDYLVIAAGTKTGFFGNQNIKNHSITIKTLNDAGILRNQVLLRLELADQQESSRQAELLSFVVVGGGFSGVETAGEINEFICEAAIKYYRNIEMQNISVTLIAARDHILPEIGRLGLHAAASLRKASVSIKYDTKVTDADSTHVTLNDGSKLPYSVLVWAGGNEPQDFVRELAVEKSKSGRIIVDKYLRIPGHPDILALGDCAHIPDTDGNPYPPTAQHAIREAGTASHNMISMIRAGSLKEFRYSSKGTMAKIGKRDGVARVLGFNLTGFGAWFVWKQYYLSTLPVLEKRIRVGLDWFVDLFFARDITKV